MSKYDCSIKERRGCNYCLRRKTIYTKDGDSSATILEEENIMRLYDYQEEVIGDIPIRYCPICGRKLEGE
ncbi:hypothetical protein AB8U03_15445 [Clostridium sp. Mt-5]|uniref:Uncharacterized protein n=1 Tax=Clostridium moutaii TaxID=3240932 RepID=A0ABV4BST8_9CLOT